VVAAVSHSVSWQPSDSSGSPNHQNRRANKLILCTSQTDMSNVKELEVLLMCDDLTVPSSLLSPPRTTEPLWKEHTAGHPSHSA
ncbi:hypothetical protein J0S82_006382, partial [Galemys pyrenaicus]